MDSKTASNSSPQTFNAPLSGSGVASKNSKRKLPTVGYKAPEPLDASIQESKKRTSSNSYKHFEI